ncbi:MAG: hypothetical protein A3C90_04005 [Candidatus Magasanikbacteria bacterium RIFCSPHIGHO2_02_FULL_51_14]|uniref:Type II secretion system protein J n=1 Tax=Candidatus Magasanikbacteria bacterium RIFCSPHIGHO2_02_FULL_51_14 TaxID=1798683 RepID=A0A1F6MDK1_9BACT|nr:MAG: hypothetical protein A3C90_04005 [Candidatus Magasanikbacteria bacterium RIFCSPHIGHO2_02_FULL_51_14]
MRSVQPKQICNLKSAICNPQRGFTLIEMLAYVALMVVVIATVAAFVSWLVKINSYAQINATVLENAKSAMGMMAQEIQHARSVYAPTSVFGVHPGQLSLETTRNTPTGEDTTFVDVYVDSERLYVKRESAAEALLASERARVTNLVFTHLYPTSTIPAIRIELTMEYDTTSPELRARSRVSLSSTVSLRSY